MDLMILSCGTLSIRITSWSMPQSRNRSMARMQLSGEPKTAAPERSLKYSKSSVFFATSVILFM